MKMSSSPQEHLLQGSVVRKTKEKFDSFLKDALQESSHTSPKEHTEAKTSKTFVSVQNINEPSEEEKREFILNKFFENSTSSHGENEGKPIPKPRTKLRSNNARNTTLSPHSSNETFRINKPREISREGKSQSSGSSASSTNTYKVSSPKIVNAPNDESSSHKTFRISKDVVPKIGDIIIHEKDSVSKIVDVKVKNDINIPISRETASESRSNSSDSQKFSGDKSNTYSKTNGDLENEPSTSNYPPPKDEKVVNNVLNITIHKTDKLQLNSFVIHPVVKIHIVDIHTGRYFPKNHKRSVTYPPEDNLDHLAPIMTHPYSLQEKRSLIPSWEETILIYEDYSYIVDQKENIIIFFELLDFLPMPLINNKTKGWHRIAFAFLKVSGKNNVLNFNKNMRLQLYHSTSKNEDVRKCSIWETWNKGRLLKYPSSLYVSITINELKDKSSASLRCLLPLEKEIEDNSKTVKEITLENSSMKTDVNSLLKNTLVSNQEWKTTRKEITKLPNECLAHFETAKEGCFTLRFNNNGSLLACALKLNNVYCIVIFSMVTFEQVCYLPGHQDLIYSIQWSPDDSLIIACSGDCSVSVWDVNKVSFLQILPHPNFVYTNDMSSNLIVTGCYDTKVRVWSNEGLLTKYFLNQELEGHKGYITSLLLKRSCDTILSSDSLGVIIEWYKQKSMWVLHKKINILGLEGITINQIEFMAKGKRLLVHSRDNILRIIDLESSVVIHWLQGGLNTRFHTSCSISPCGNYVIAGSENSSVNIWKVKTGKFVGSLIPYKNKGVTIHALQFHPKDNIIAVGSFGDDLPVLLFGYNEKNKECEIDLRLVAEKKKNMSETERFKKDTSKSDQNNLHFQSVLDKFDKLMMRKLK
ncbi:jouberin-like [Coccinella septempunctata]|uniref:jouberin-like n=1 Tax=Coccinella septempunctata TaxID=41139 RepID=UPI001D08B22E|nr:jouberin-like [Coccinella septempunctata]